jgi:uncharacterized membrane protein
MDVIASVLSGMRVIFGFLLLLFIPGFFLSLVIFPRLSEIRIFERLVYSFVLSIGSVIVYVLFMDVVLGIDTTSFNIFIILVGFSLVLSAIWIVRRFLLTFSLMEKISDFMKKLNANYSGILAGRKVRERYKAKLKDPPDNNDKEL